MTDRLRRILYLEDDPILAHLTMAALSSSWDFDIFHVDTGQRALETVSVFDPQLLLLDVMLPDMDGPEVLQRIRQMPAFEDTPAVFMTAKAQVHEQKEYLAIGACGVLVKPYDPNEIGNQLKQFWSTAVQNTSAAISEPAGQD